MNTRFLETFVWLSRLKSFSRTAEKLHASQPAISGRVAALEEILGVVLYERNAKGFELTPAGRKILGHCETIVDLTNDLKSIVTEEGALGRPIRIGSADVASVTWLPAFLERVCREHPEYNFEVLTDAGVNLSALLLADSIDVAFIVNGIDDARIMNAPLCSYRARWVANPKFFDVTGETSIEALCKLPIITAPPESVSYRWQIEYFKRHWPQFDPRAATRLRVACGASLVTGIEMAQRGLGVMPVPVLLARDSIARGELRALNVTEQFPDWNLMACYKAPATIPALLSLVECAQAETKRYALALGHGDMWP